MNGKRTISVAISFIIYILLSNAIMCQSQNSNNADFNNDIKKDPAELIKSLVDKDIVSNITGRSARLSNYIMLLYNALEISTENQHASGNVRPKIRSFRALKGGEDKFTFKLSNVWNSRVERVEIVIRIDKIRHAIHAGNKSSLFVHDPHFRSVESKQYSSYLIFDVTSLKERSPKNVAIDRFLNVNKHRIRISQRNEPLLLVYENLNHNPLLNKERIAHREKRDAFSNFDCYSGGVNTQPCKKYEWMLDVSLIPGLDWWLFPRVYNASFCDGECKFPLTMNANSTTYSLMKSVWHFQTFSMDEDVPKARCVPVEYEPLQIIFLTNKLEQDIMMIDNMIVKSCGCI